MLTDDVRRTAEACLYYKLTSEPKGSGELKRRREKWEGRRAKWPGLEMGKSGGRRKAPPLPPNQIFNNGGAGKRG